MTKRNGASTLPYDSHLPAKRTHTPVPETPCPDDRRADGAGTVGPCLAGGPRVPTAAAARRIHDDHGSRLDFGDIVVKAHDGDIMHRYIVKPDEVRRRSLSNVVRSLLARVVRCVPVGART